MLGSRDAKEIGIGCTSANFSSLITFIFGESRLDEKGASSPFLKPKRRTANDEKKSAKECAWMNRNCERAESSMKSQVLLSYEFFSGRENSYEL